VTAAFRKAVTVPRFLRSAAGGKVRVFCSEFTTATRKYTADSELSSEPPVNHVGRGTLEALTINDKRMSYRSSIQSLLEDGQSRAEEMGTGGPRTQEYEVHRWSKQRCFWNRLDTEERALVGHYQSNGHGMSPFFRVYASRVVAMTTQPSHFTSLPTSI